MTIPTPNEALLDILDRAVYGHEAAKKALIVLLQRNNMRFYQKYLQCLDREDLIDPMKILLVGASGTGKSHLIEALCKDAMFPLVKLDATQFNVVAGSGGIKVGQVKRMIKLEAERMVTAYPNYFFSVEGAIDRTVVFVDEIDKLGGKGNVGEWNSSVQGDFLTLFDNKDEFSGVSFVFAGAFSDITKYKPSRSTIGFNNEKTTESQESLDEAIIATGILPELVGRFSAIVPLDIFDEHDLMEILYRHILPKKHKDLAVYGIFGVELPEEKLQRIVKDALTSSQGVRYLKRAIDKEFLEIEFDACKDAPFFNAF